MAEGRNDFKVVLGGVRPEAQAAVAQELAGLLPVDAASALNIVKNAPIILMDKLTPQQARNVGVYATRLRSLGADIQITGQPVGKLQVLRWPFLPDIARRSSNQIICPHCGTKLNIQVHTNVSEVRAQAAHTSPEAVPAAAAADPAPAAAPVAPAPAAQPAPEVELEEVPVADGDEEVILEELSVTPEPVQAAPAMAAPAPQAAPAFAARPAHVAQPAPAAAQPALPSRAGTGTCKVILVGKIKGERKQQAAELMVEYLGITLDKAQMNLNKQTVVTVARDLSDSDANECQQRFAAIDVKVNVKS